MHPLPTGSRAASACSDRTDPRGRHRPLPRRTRQVPESLFASLSGLVTTTATVVSASAVGVLLR